MLKFLAGLCLALIIAAAIPYYAKGEEAVPLPLDAELAAPAGEYGKTQTAAETAGNKGEEYKPEELSAAVAAFLESQEPYAGETLPDSVSYDYESLPWDCCVPVAGMNSSGFGWRIHPIKGGLRFHYGTDFAAWTGEAILAFADGEVTFAGYSDSFGNYIRIEHSEGWSSLYAHCSELLVSTGDTVSAGETIALVGDTGLSTGPHLHFELTHNGIYRNPEYYVN